jgi:hypothetical protein
MRLSESYKNVRNSIVGIAPHYFPTDKPAPDFPEIFGTGFVIREDGIIATNNHVVEYLRSDKIYRPAETPEDDLGCIAVMFAMNEDAQTYVNLRILSYAIVSEFIPAKVYYGPEHPDIAFIQVHAKGLPTLELDEDIPDEGTEVATAGYPMGTGLLRIPGYIHQATPTLQRGIVSAILPWQSPNPHAFILNVMAQGGVSGSPVFLPDTGKVVGILYGACEDSLETTHQIPDDKGDPPHYHYYSAPTNMSYAVPSKLIASALNTPAVKSWKLPSCPKIPRRSRSKLKGQEVSYALSKIG